MGTVVSWVGSVGRRPPQPNPIVLRCCQRGGASHAPSVGLMLNEPLVSGPHTFAQIGGVFPAEVVEFSDIEHLAGHAVWL